MNHETEPTPKPEAIPLQRFQVQLILEAPAVDIVATRLVSTGLEPLALSISPVGQS